MIRWLWSIPLSPPDLDSLEEVPPSHRIQKPLMHSESNHQNADWRSDSVGSQANYPWFLGCRLGSSRVNYGPYNCTDRSWLFPRFDFGLPKTMDQDGTGSESGELPMVSRLSAGELESITIQLQLQVGGTFVRLPDFRDSRKTIKLKRWIRMVLVVSRGLHPPVYQGCHI